MISHDEQHGFVLSGIALLLILPALLLASSCLVLVETGGGAVSSQAISDKVYFTGRDAERTIIWMENHGQPTCKITLSGLADEYEAATGLTVEIFPDPENPAKIHIEVRDPRGAARYRSIVDLI